MKEVQASDTEKLAKAIANSGLCSRRCAEAFILGGRVTVDGCVVNLPKVRVGRGNIICVDGTPLSPAAEQSQVWRFYKPAGCIVSRVDPEGRKTVYDLLPSHLKKLKTVGRLDQNSEGLLLLSNDGAIIERLTHPRYEVKRTYHVRVFGVVTESVLQQLACKQGHTLQGVHYRITEAHFVKKETLSLCQATKTPRNHWLSLSIQEGKNREIRKVLGHFDLGISRLIRVAFGPFRLDGLKAGAYEQCPAHALQAFTARTHIQ